MGFRFMAIATDKVYKPEKPDEISFQFWMKKLKFVKEVSMEEAMEINFYDRRQVDIAFLPEGTLIFVSDPKIEEKANIRRNSFEGKAGFFVVDETSMTFLAAFYENYKMLLRHYEHNREVEELSRDGDTVFDLPYSDGFELATNSISAIIGQRFFDIKPDQIFHRFHLTDEKLNDSDYESIPFDKTWWFIKLKTFIEKKSGKG